jgi:hypothetical protein
VKPPGVVTLGVGGVLIEASGVPDTFGEVFREVADVAASFFSAAEDALDVHLGAEAHHMRGLGQILACLFPGRQRRPRVGVGKGLGPDVPHR